MQCLLHSRLSANVSLHVVFQSMTQHCLGEASTKALCGAGSGGGWLGGRPVLSRGQLSPWMSFQRGCLNLKAEGSFWLLLRCVSAW